MPSTAPRSRTSRWSTVRRAADAVRTAGGPGSPGLTTRLAAVPRMVRARLDGTYDGISHARLAALAAAAAYVASPVDLVPEALLPVIGLADDAMLLAWFAKALVQDTDDFLAWERGRGQPVQEHRVR